MMPSVGESGRTVRATPQVYHDLGVRVFINAAGTYTRLGGSRMAPAVVDAMAEAARCFVDVDDLQARAGDRIAALTRNDAAYVTSGAAAGLILATAACMVGTDPARAWQLPETPGLRTQIVVHRAHRNPYDYAVRTLPIHLIEIGFPNDIAPTQPWELDHVLGDQCAAVLYVAAAWTASGALPLDDVVAIAHRKGVPVIVDAAAQLPPTENLWRLTGLGADLVIFSGGKDLRGPQASGLIVGRRDLIEACRLIGAPHHGIGRPFKVGKEEMIGLLAAVQVYLEHDDEARARWAEGVVAALIDRLDGRGVRARRSFPNEAGQPLPRALVQFMGEDAGARRDRVVSYLRAGQPSVEVGVADVDGIYINPMTLDVGEEELLLPCLCTAVDAVAGDRR